MIGYEVQIRMVKTMSKDKDLTIHEVKKLNDIISETIDKLISLADSENIDRDSLIKYFADVFGVMAEVTTFKQYKRNGW